MRPRPLTLILGLMLTCMGGCESSSHFRQIAANLADDKFCVVCESYSYHELVGAHMGTISDQKLWLYEIDVNDPPRRAGSSWTARRLPLPKRIRLEDARLIANSRLGIAEYSAWNEDERHLEFQTWDINSGGPVGPLVKCPANSTEFYNSGFFKPTALHAFTASNRLLVVQSGTKTTARDMISGDEVQAGGLAEMIDRAATISRPVSEQMVPVFTEDLHFLVIVPPQWFRRTPYSEFTADGSTYSLRDFGYFVERGSSSIRPYPMWQGNASFGSAESDHGKLILLYGSHREVVLRSLDGSFQARAAAPFPLPKIFESNRPEFTPQKVFWDVSRGRLIIWDVGRSLFVWDYTAGKSRSIADPSGSKPHLP